MALEIDRKLNLVLTVERADGSVAYVHSTPIRHEVFKRYYKVIAQAFSQIYAGGLGPLAAPRVAALLIRDLAQQAGTLEGPAGVENGLFGEMQRCTMVIVPGDRGWDTLPLADALQRKLLSEEDASEVENAVAFFTVASAMHTRKILTAALEGMKDLWGAQFVSLSSTAYASSLPLASKSASVA